ncbi:hypothetical protein, partial [Ilumatobacter sp.]|uniref:hypothetical protein n=1 Tax=Ilumatobacter sp. TaxID=1967498 RepID=UPI003C639CEE
THTHQTPPPPIRRDYENPLGEKLDSRWVSFIDPTIPRHLHPDLHRPDAVHFERSESDDPDLDTG